MIASENVERGHVLRAADRFYQKVFCCNIEFSTGGSNCGAVGVTCPRCGKWGSYNVVYPTIDCSSLMKLGERITQNIVIGDDFKYVTPDEFADFSRELTTALGPNRPVVPGALFGVLGGWAIGKIGDFAWINDDIPVVRESVFQAMVDAGFPVAGAAMPIRARRDLGERIIHLEIPPTARLAAASEITKCEICGRFESCNSKIIDANSFDDSIPFQRILELPSMLVVTAAVAEFIKIKKFSDVAFDPLEFA